MSRRLFRAVGTSTGSFRWISIIPFSLAILVISAGMSVTPASAATTGAEPTSCDPGWYWVDEVDDSFSWQESWIPFRSVSWSGSVQLVEEYDADCYVVGIAVGFTGPDSGGTLVLQGDLFVSYTIQYPGPFESYANVGSNAIGQLSNYNPPAGGWPPELPVFYVEPRYDINPSGADEFLIRGTALPGIASDVTAYFELPTELLGQTVYAQVHVGADLCQCSVTGIFLPGESPPPPDSPPTASFEFSPTSPLVGETVTFDASASTDDFGIAAYDWDFGDGGTGRGMVTTHAYATAGDFLVVLAVTDTGGNQDFAVATVTVGEPPAIPAEVWDVYVHAHQDDWQLFEAPDPYYDYLNGSHLLIVYVSAGDAGGGLRWEAREEAAKASVRELIGTGLAESSEWVNVCTEGTLPVCRDVWTWTYDRTVSVFMRTPDGGVLGGGFSSNNYESLSKLRDGNISSVTTVDRSTTYNGWEEFYLTLRAVINAYAPYDSTTTVNAPDFDRDRQTSQGEICTGCLDHADHLAVADAVYAISIGMGAPWKRAFFIDYPLGFADPRYPVNLGSADYDIKKRLFMAYRDEMFRLTGVDEYSAMPWFWENCFQRDYYRGV